MARLRGRHATEEEPERWCTLHQLARPGWTTEKVIALGDFAAADSPVLAILGQFDDFFLPEDAVALARSMPKGEVAILPGARHAAFRDAAPIWNAVVLDFLAPSLTEETSP